MALFQHAVLGKYLSGVGGPEVDEAWERFTAHFHDPAIQQNIRNSKEEEYQAGFLADLFEKVLGYTIYPANGYNLRIEQKDEKGSKKADAALLKNEKVAAVIELKGTDTTDFTSLYFDFEKQIVAFNNLVLSKFDIDKLTRKLENWHELTFKQFLNELKKKKVSLSLKEEAEWMKYFNGQKAKACELKSQIEQTDREIDEMVYGLYGLGERERNVVEGVMP